MKRLLFVLFSGLLSVCHSYPQTSNYNVVFVIVDDLNTSIGCYGNEFVRTPNIDRLAEQSYVFENAFCNFPLCNPSRSSFLTGKRPDSILVYGNEVHIRQYNPGIETLPQMFRNNGYRSIGTGKVFHPGKNDSPSWDEFMTSSVNKYLNEANILKLENGQKAPPYENADVGPFEYKDGQVLLQALKFLEENQLNRFFLAVGFTKPHLPYTSPLDFWRVVREDSLDDRQDLPAATWSRFTKANDILRYDSGSLVFEDPDYMRFLQRQYYSSVYYIDHLFGLLIDKVVELGLSDNTIIVLLSDHGYKIGDFGLWSKNTPLFVDNRVPLIIHLPGQTNSYRQQQIVELIDLYPTLAELTGLEVPNAIEGESFVSSLQSDSPHKGFAFSQVVRFDGCESCGYTMAYSMYDANSRYTAYLRDNEFDIFREEYFFGNPHDMELINRIGSFEYTPAVNDFQLAITNPNRRTFPTDEEDIKLSVNPLTNSLNVLFMEPSLWRNADVRVYDLNGRKVEFKYMLNSEDRIEIQLIGVRDGIYIVMLINDQKAVVDAVQLFQE